MPLPQGFVPEAPTSGTVPDASYGAQQYTAKRKAGGDIPPNSPLSPDTSAFSRFMQNAGLPDSWEALKQISQRFDALGPAALVPLPQTAQQWNAKPPLETAANLIPGGSLLTGLANIPANVQDKNYAGALGSMAIPAALAYGGMKATTPTDPVVGYGPPQVVPRSMPARALGTAFTVADQITPEFMRPKGLKTAADFLSKKTVTPKIRASELYTVPKGSGTDFPFEPPSAPVPNPEPSAGSPPLNIPEDVQLQANAIRYKVAPARISGSGTEFPFNSPSAPVTAPEPSLGSTPLHNPQDIMAKAGLPSLWQNEAPTSANAAFGNAPTQPVNPIAGPHPSGVNGLNLPNVAQARTIPGTYFQPGEFAQLMEQLRQHGANRSEIHAAQQQGITNLIRDAVNSDPTPNLTLKAVAAARKAKSKK